MAGFKRREQTEKIKLEKGAFKRALRVFRFITPYKITFGIGLLFLLLSSITTMGFPYLIGEMFGAKEVGKIGVSALNTNEIKTLDNINLIMLLLFAVFIANAVFSFFRIYLFSQVTEKALQDLRNEAFRKLIYSPVTFFDKNKTGELTSRIATDVSLLQEMLTTTLAEFIRQWVTIIVSVAVIAYTSVKLSLIMLSVVPIVLILVIVFGKAIKKISKETQDVAAESNSILSEALQGIKVVKAFANEQFEIARYGKSTRRIKDLAIKGSKWRGLFASFIIIGLFGSISIVIWQGMIMVNQGELEMAEFVRFIFFTVFLGASFGGVGAMFGTIQKSIGATERLMDLVDKEIENINTKGIRAVLKGDVEFKSVSFKYETRTDMDVLQDITINVSSGENIALVGPSGAGKSTLVSLLLRFYEPTEGQILFDGINSKNYNLTALRSNMAIVPQEVILFAGTIRDNIAYGRPNASEKEIIEAAKQANAYEFIQTFPDGLDTLVGERGIQMSGGQKQRIAIARAVLKNPKILILDEATSSLDSESEKLVQEALDKLMKNRTTFVIAHRLSTIRNADKILVMENGRIVETGTHEELSQRQGVYAKLSAIQSGG